MNKLFWAACFIMLAALPACDGTKPVDPRASPGELNDLGRPAMSSGAPEGWGRKLLSLIPDRGDESTPSLAKVQSVFEDCAIPDSRLISGRCDLSARAPSSPSAPSVLIEIETSGSEARAIRLKACCSSEDSFFRPLEAEPVIRTELICPELTIVSSQPVHAYRVSSPGRRDFVYARASRTTPQGRQVDLTILLSRVEPSDECSVLAAAHVRPTGSSQ